MITSKMHLTSHFIDTCSDPFSGTLLNVCLQLLLQRPDITSDISHLCYTSQSTMSGLQVDRHHVTFGPVHVVWLLVEVGNWRLPCWGVAVSRCYFWDCFGWQESLYVFPQFFGLYYFHIDVLFVFVDLLGCEKAGGACGNFSVKNLKSEILIDLRTLMNLILLSNTNHLCSVSS